MRYSLALAAVVAISAAAWIFYRTTRTAFLVVVREVVQRELQDPDHDPELEEIARQIDAGEPVADVGLELPESMVLRITVADVIATFWWIWLPLTAAAAFGIAWLVGPSKSDPAKPTTVSAAR